ncbi:MAG: hypothetical protein WBD79_13065, partial [Anaerolineae bacterium]
MTTSQSVMIALVSEQRMQNIIPMLQANASYDRIWLVRSTDADMPGSRFAKAWQNTSDVLKTVCEVESAEPAVCAY